MDHHNIARVVDTRIEANSMNQVTYVVEEGAAVTSYVPLTAGSWSNLNINFNLNNIADRTCRDSRLVLGLPWTLTLNVNNPTLAAAKILNSDNFGYKCRPATRIMSSIQHQINQASYTIYPSRYIDAISRLNNFSDDANFYDNTQPDVIDSYANASGSNLNPLGNFSTTLNGDGVFKPRSMNYAITAGSNSVAASSTGTVTISGFLYEPLASPFNNISSKNRRGLYAITGEIVQLQLVQDLTRMFGLYLQGGLTLTNAVCTIGNAWNSPQNYPQVPTLYCIYLTPHEDYFKEIPRESVYPYNNYEVFTNEVGALTAGSTASVTTQVVNMTNVPEKILIYAKLSDTYVNMTTPDKYAAIDNLSVQFDNGVPVLNQASNRQLYDISKRNGLVMPEQCFQQWQLNLGVTNGTPSVPKLYGCGSVVTLTPIDLGMRPGAASGSAGRYIMQATLKLHNYTDTDFPGVTLHVVVITAGVLERIGSQYRNMLSTLPRDVLSIAHSLPAVDQENYLSSKHDNGFLSGGGIADFFKKAFGQ
jgi:hypothetical protein